jgi:hypothetical protein
VGTRRIVTGALAAGAIAFGVVEACRPVRGEPTRNIPVNDCADNACAKYEKPPGLVSYQCSRDTCVSSDAFQPILIVSVPTNAANAPGFTMALERASGRDVALEPKCFGDNRCFIVPPAIKLSGAYRVTPALEQQVGVSLHGDGSVTSIPAQATLRPLWPPADAGLEGGVEAPAAGIPLETLFAGQGAENETNGPKGQRVQRWALNMIGGNYELTVSPVPPFDTVFPPTVERLSLAGSTVRDQDLTGVDYPNDAAQPRTPTITRSTGTLDGWSAFVRAAATGRLVSQRAPLKGSGGPVTLNTIGHLTFETGEVELVVEPPAGEAIPMLVSSVLTDSLKADIRYPALPLVPVVSGSVTDAVGNAISAELIFREARDNLGGRLTTTEPTDRFRSFLRYATRVSATPQDGYRVRLPPGEYDVYVIPSAESGLAAMLSTKFVVRTALVKDESQAGRTLQVINALSTVTGSCSLTDGRPIGGAEVVAAPVVDPKGDPQRLPRGGRAMTNDEGIFAMQIDPGLYDITVRPAQGSRFPWKVSTSHLVAKGLNDIAPIRVPPPIEIRMVLLDPARSAVPQAIVRAFVVATAASAGAARAVEIGQWLTDPNGSAQLLLARPE